MCLRISGIWTCYHLYKDLIWSWEISRSSSSKFGTFLIMVCSHHQMSSRVRKWVGVVFEVVIFCKTNPWARILRCVRTFPPHFTPQHLILRHIRAAFISFSSFEAKLNWKTAFYPLRPKTRVSLQELLFIPLFVRRRPLCLLANDQRLLCYCQTKLPKEEEKEGEEIFWRWCWPSKVP